MKNISIKEICNSDTISEFAKKNYKTYVEHYKARKLTPIPFQEFIKNYTSY